MSSWTEVNTGYDSDEETVNFGRRHIVEADHGTFECSTLATFSSPLVVQATTAPSVRSISSPEILCMCIEETLSIFDVPNKSLISNIKFSSPIKSLALTVDSKFLFLYEELGSLFIIHVPTNKIVFSRCLTPENEEKNADICQILLDQKSNEVTVLTVCGDGTLYSIGPIDLTTLENNIHSQELEQLNVVINKFKITQTVQISCATLVLQKETQSINLMLAGDALVLCELTNLGLKVLCHIPLELTNHITKLITTSNISVILALQKNGNVLKICPFTMMYSNTIPFDFTVYDFMIMEDKEANMSQFFTLSQVGNKSEIQLINKEGMESIYKIVLNSVLSLIMVTSMVEDALFLEGEYEEGRLRKILLRAVTKSQPEFRLERLLRQRKFEEAKEFAILHNLDIQMVYREEAVSYIQRMSSWSAGNDEAANYCASHLITLLNKLSDTEFVVKCCLQTIPPNVMQTRELFMYARKRIFDLETQESKHLELQSVVCNQIQRLDTFEIISETLLSEDWLSFSTRDLLEVYCTFIQNNEIGCATILWMRHESELLNKIPDEDIALILHLIPADLDTISLISFMSAYVPSVLSFNASKLSDIITWIHQKVNLLEWDCPNQWPKVALDFCERSLQLLQPPASDGLSNWLLYLHQQHSKPDSPLEKLQQTKDALTDIMCLRTQFGIYISMCDYTQPDKLKVCHILIKHTRASKLEDLIKNLLSQIVLKISLDIEEVITSYIEATIGSQSWIYYESIPNENEIITLIRLLKNMEKTFTCIVLVLKAAPVPWSNNLLKLVEDYENYEHYRSEEIREEQIAYVEKLIFKKYNIIELFDQDRRDVMLEQITKAIFKEERPEMLSDALKVAHKNPKAIETVHSIYLEYLLKVGRLSVARKHLENLPSKLCAEVCERVLCKIHAAMKTGMDFDVMDSYIAFLEPILEYLETTYALEDETSSKILSTEFIFMTKLMKNSFTLERKYGIKCHSIFMNYTEKIKIFVCHVKNSLGRISTTALLTSMTGVAKLLELRELEATLLLAEVACTSEQYTVATEAFKTLEPTMEMLNKSEIDVVHRLIKPLLPSFQKIANADPEFWPTLNRVMCIVVSNCAIDDVDEVLSLLHNVQHASHLALQKQNTHSVLDSLLPVASLIHDPFKYWNFNPIYEDMPLDVERSCSVMEKYFSYMWVPVKLDQKHVPIKMEVSTDVTHALLTWNEESSQNSIVEDEQSHEEKLVSTVNHLCAENYDLLALKLICETIAKNLECPKLKMNSLLSKCSLKLLQRIMAARKADLVLALALLETVPMNDAIAWLENAIKRVRYECNHLTRITQLAIDFSCLSSNNERIGELCKLNQVGVWGKRLQKMGLSNKMLMKGVRENAWHVLLVLIQDCPNIEIETVLSFCRDFDVPFDAAILMCLEHLITSWNPEITVVRDNDGMESIAHNDYQHEMKKVQYYAQLVSEKSKRDLERKLNSIWDKLNTYHYEMYWCILHLKQMLNPDCDMTVTQKSILLFLMPYKRRIPPQMQEIEKWHRFHPDSTELPKIAKWRLPYPLFLEESKNMIEMEVNLQNYRIWLNAPSALNCDLNLICVAAIKNSISKNICLAKMDEWCTQARDEKLVSDIGECVNCMTDLPVASALLDYVSKRTPPGLDKLSLVEMCLLKVKAWYTETLSEESKDMEKKISKRLSLYTTYHLLHEQGLGSPEYLALAENPCTLVEALYKNPKILERGRGISQHYPDIHHAVNLLGQLHNINVEKLRHNLLEGWLLSDMLTSGSLDESFVDTSRVWQQYEQDISEAHEEAANNLLRARYVLEAGNTDANVDYLVGLCFSPRTFCEARIKLRALNCLHWIIPSEQLSTHIGRDPAYIREYANGLFLLSELEQVQGQLNMSVEEFKERDKASIIDSLWIGHSQNPRALMLMCHICIQYAINNPRVWANMLSRMQQLNMIKELQLILPKLNRVAHTLCTPQFVNAWNKVLMTPFEKVDDPVTKEQEEACAHSLVLLQGCPVLKNMDMKKIFKLCIEANRFDFAAIILPLSSISERIPLIQELLSKTTISHLKTSLEDLRIYASLPIPQALHILENNTLETN